MINDIFSEVSLGVEKSLFADDRALWKRGRNVQDVVKGIQNAIRYGQINGDLIYQCRKHR